MGRLAEIVDGIKDPRQTQRREKKTELRAQSWYAPATEIPVEEEAIEKAGLCSRGIRSSKRAQMKRQVIGVDLTQPKVKMKISQAVLLSSQLCWAHVVALAVQIGI